MSVTPYRQPHLSVTMTSQMTGASHTSCNYVLFFCLSYTLVSEILLLEAQGLFGFTFWIQDINVKMHHSSKVHQI